MGKMRRSTGVPEGTTRQSGRVKPLYEISWRSLDLGSIAGGHISSRSKIELWGLRYRRAGNGRVFRSWILLISRINTPYRNDVWVGHPWNMPVSRS